MTDKLRGALAACARFAKREAVFTAALLLALGSLFLVPQNESPLPWSAIDWDTLALLFSLMAVMKGAQRLGLFAYCGSVLLRRTKSTRQMMSVLVFLPFFCSMAITNDVALLTFDNYPFSMLMDPTVTAVEVDMYDMGVNAARFVLQRVRKPNLRTQSYVTSPCILEREST